jgi:hypothetical protein
MADCYNCYKGCGKPRGSGRSAPLVTSRSQTQTKANFALVISLAVLLAFAPATRAETHRIPFKVHGGLLFIPCSTDDGLYDCVIDTGASRTVVDEHATTRPALLNGDIAHGVGGAKKMTTVNTVITIGGMRLSLVVAVMPLRPATHADVIIGEDILGYFASVTIDYKNSVIVFER